MGKIVISANATLDGMIEDPDGEEGFARGGWFHQFVGGEDLEAWVARETEEALGAKALLLGARSSEWLASRMLLRGDADVRVSPAWAERVKSLPKYIVASTLRDPRWGNATILGGDIVKAIMELKLKLDGEILVYGSYHLLRTLIERDLADELRLMVFPVVLGAGARLFGETSRRKPMRLIETRRIGAGLVFHAYEFTRA